MSAEFDFSYMAPPQEAYQIRHSDQYIVNGTPPKYLRMIYEQVPYLDSEKKKMEEFKNFLAQKHPNIKLPEDWRESDYLKILQCSGFGSKWDETIKTLQAHLAWRNDPTNHRLNPEILPLLQKGTIYVCGRDKGLRPIVILNAHFLDPKKPEAIVQAISYLLGQVVKHMMIPYHIENWIMIIETNKIGVTSLPLKTLGKIISNMQTNFCGRLDKMFVLNPSGGLSFIWKAVSGFIDARTLQKIGFLSSKEIHKIQEKVDPSQLEVKYGGKIPNLTEFWPPKNFDPIKEVPAPVKIEIIQETTIVVNEIRIEQDEIQQDQENHQKINGQEVALNGEEKDEKADDKKNQLTPSSNQDDQFQNQMFSPSPQAQDDQYLAQSPQVQIIEDQQQDIKQEKPHDLHARNEPDIQDQDLKDQQHVKQDDQHHQNHEEQLEINEPKSIMHVKDEEQVYPTVMIEEQDEKKCLVEHHEGKKVEMQQQQSPKEIKQIPFDQPNNGSCCSRGCAIF